MEPRSYQACDQDGCLAVFDSNQLAGREEFEKFLEDGPADFTVLEHEGAIVGCGGYTLGADGVASLQRGMIRRDVQRMGLGRFLLLYRLRQISKAGATVARLSAPAGFEPFYGKQGFKRGGPGPHDFVMKLTVCP